MLLNHLPITFSSNEFNGFSLSYDSADTLKRLRTEIAGTHFCYRYDEKILLFPYEQGAATQGEKEDETTCMNRESTESSFQIFIVSR